MELTDLAAACRNLTSDKVTERKKHATQLRQLLKKKPVIKYLDSNSGKFGWTDVLKDVVRYVNVETHALQKSRASQTGQTMANKKREVASLFKFVVEIADKRGPQLKCTFVIKHIINVLGDSFMCECYGQVYSNILLKHVLSVRKYLTEIPAAQWLLLLKIYCSTFQSDETDCNHLLHARLIYALIQTVSLHTDVPTEDLLKFYSDFFQSARIRKEKLTVVEYILRSVNFFVKLVGAESRQQMCKFGEASILQLLYIWNHKNSSLQTQIVEFFGVQMKIHHPGGAKTEEFGAFAADWDQWKSHLRALYEMIYNDLQDMASRHTFASSPRENVTILDSQYVEFAADVYHQVLSDRVIEVTQRNFEEATTGSCHKKRRLESGWSALREEISSIGTDTKVIPWLQVMKCLLQKYPTDLSSEDEFLPLFQTLAQFLADSKRAHVTVHLLSCLQVLAPLFTSQEARSIWAKVWATCLRIGNLHLCKDSSYQLMSTILHYSLVQPQKEMWNLFVPLRTSPTEDSIRFLATYCSYYDLPEQYQPVLLDKTTLIHPPGSSPITNSAEDSYPLRKMLIEWLLPSWEDEGESDMATTSKNPNLHLIDCDILASVLVSLFLSRPIIKPDCCHLKIPKMELSDLESTYLEMAFKTNCNDLSQPRPMLSTTTAPNCSLDSVMNIFLESIKRLVSHVLKLDDVPETLRKLSYVSCLLSKCLIHLLDRNIIERSSTVLTQLHKILESTMTQISQLLTKLGNSCVSLALPLLIQMFSPCGTKQELHFEHFKLLRSLTSYDVFLGIVSSQIQQCKGGALVTQTTQSTTGRMTQRFAPLDDDFDADFVNATSGDESDDEEVVTESDESQRHTIDLFTQKLNVEEQLSCQSLHFLCLWCSYDHFSLLNSDPASLLVRDHIESNLSIESFDVTKAFHLQMIKIIISTVCCSGQQLPGYSISYLLKALMKIMKQHYRDQNIVQTCIELVTMIIPHLSCGSEEMVSIEMNENRDSLLNLFSGIWLLQNKGKYHSRVRLALAKCLLTFIQNDPEGKWTIDNSDEGENVPMWRQFPNYLSDASLEVRLYCARNISSLFRTRDKSGKTHPLSRQQQEETFQKVYECTEDCLNTQLAEFSTERQKDERSGRIASLLQALSCVATSSRLCERNAIFTCCSHTQLNNDITVASVQNVLSLAVQQLKYSSLEDLIISHLPFLINKWLTNNLGMARFPYQLLNCSSEADFYMKYPKVCLPFLMLTKHEVGIEANLVKQMGDQWLVAQLKLCVLKLMVHILPYFAVNHYQVNDEKLQKKVATSSERYKLLLRHISKEDIEQNIQKRLSEQVVEILLCLEEKRNRPNVSDPSPNPPFYSYDVIMATLNFLTVSFMDDSSTGDKSLVYVLSKAPENFQKILQSLAVHLGGCTHLSEQYRAICRYELFVKLLLQEFNTSLGGCRDYIMREVIYRLLHTIKRLALQITNGVECSHDLGYLEDTIVRGLRLVQTISEQAIINCPEEFCKYLPQVIHALLPYSSGFMFSEDVLCLLKLVVIDNSCVLKSGILLLDPFPDTEVLRPLCKEHNSIKYEHGEFTLAQEIESFLKNGQETVMCGDMRSEEGLKFLHGQLSSCTTELKILLDQCKAEHRGNIVCQLVQELAYLVQSQSGAVAEAAATCLGDIGPIDLSSWTSSSQRSRGLNHDGYRLEQSQIYQVHPPLQKYFWIFYWLNQYLVDSCLNTVQAASQVLSSMLSTKTGKDFCKNYLSEIDFLFNYLHPFVKKRTCESSKPSVNNVEINDPNVWNPPHNDHEKWIKNLTCSLICSGYVKDEILQVLEPICNVKAEFCELVLPYLVHDILVSGKGAYNQILMKHINSFFAERCVTPYNCQNSLLSSVNSVKICMNKQSVQKMLDVVQYLRNQPRVISTKNRHSADSLTPWDNNFWLDFNYSHIANAANFCSAHFSAILYTEIWWYAKLSAEEQNTPDSHQGSRGHCFLDSLTLCSTSDPEIIVQEILLKAYREIGDPDGPYGCGAGTLSDPTSRIQTYEHENQWGRAAVSYDIALSQPTPALQHGVLNALHKYGLSHVLETYLSSMENANTLSMSSKLQELRYEAAWQAGQWNLDVPSRVNDDWKYHQSLYAAMASLSRNQIHLSNEAAHAAKLSVMQSLRVNSLESCSPLYLALSQLTSLSQLSHILQSDRDDHLKTILEKWNSQQQLWDADFEYVEPIQKLQCSLLSEHMKSLDENPHPVELLGLYTQYKQLIKTARKAGKYEVAERSLHLLKRLKDRHEMDESISLQIDVEESMLFWQRGEHTIAKHLMKTVIKQLQRRHSSGGGDQITELYSMTLNTYGNWLAETRTENPRIIIESYLEKAVSLLQASTSQNNSSPLDAFLSLACYSHTQYMNTTKYMESTTFEAKKELMLKAQHEAQELKNLKERDCARFMRTLERQSAIDKAEVLATQEDRNQFLIRAVVNFIKCLRYGDSHDLHIFTLISLWFENSHSNDLVHLLQKKGLSRLKTSKFLPLMYQLAARMGSQETPFYMTLNKIIEQVTQDHPHHSLYIVMALANAHKDDDFLQIPGRQGKKENVNEDTNSQDRANAAKKMISTLSTTKIAPNVKDMVRLCEAYIELANFDVEKYRRETKAIRLPSSFCITKLKSLRHIAVATSNIPIDPSGVYAEIPYVTGFEPNFKLAGGINLPKIILCNGSNGLKYRQLVKGRDDLRQDAIMQQVFGLVNKLLDNDTDARKRQLNICTYKVIPLSQRSGLLEWCEGTQPLGEYLVGKDKGAHQRYRPQDWSAMECRKKLSEAPAKRKEEVYEEICQNFHPVLRHFFFEKFFDPVKWYECRTAYIKSVATNSIVGYILGLGDRHVQNILINCETAQLVHIDLGMAFEQGRILPTPETVAFRLTRDIVDGMGVSGVEGIFRRCCEKTMLVMRNNQQSLLTILQVLLYDPLYNWTLSPVKARQLQQKQQQRDTCKKNNNNTPLIPNNGDPGMDMSLNSDDSTNVNKVAKRVLLRFQQKLQGIEDGVQLSLAGQINHLIQEAQDPKNLCKLFPGWQPYI